MSHYVKRKVIRLPFPQAILEKCNVDSAFDCEDYLKEKLGDLFDCDDNEGQPYFDTENTTKRTYLDYVLLESNDDENFGDFGIALLLNDKDYDKYLPLFNKLEIEFNKEDLRKVVYSYYNCSEPTDYYEAVEDVFECL